MQRKDETFNHIINKWSKLVQEENKIGHYWVRKVIHCELCKRLNIDHNTKWYIYKPESVLENETHKILWDFEIQTNHLILARKPDQILMNTKKKRTCCQVDIVVPADHKVNRETNTLTFPEN